MRNWTVKEAVATINAGTDLEGIQEIAKHFPLFFMAACQNDLSAASQLMTDKFTLNRLTKAPVEATVEEDTDGEADTAEEADDEDLENMSTKQLIALCGKRGIKVPKYGKNKQFYLDALAGGKDEDEGTEDGEDAEEDNGYEGKSAKELFELCKKRGIKAQPKKKAADYIKLLEAANAEADSDDEDDEWEEEEEAPKAKQAKGKGAKASKAKPAKKAEPEEEETEDEDGDDWDI